MQTLITKMLTALVSVCLSAFPSAANACTIYRPAPPPLNSVPPGTVSVMRVKVLSVHRSRDEDRTLIASVKVVKVYRGQNPRSNREMRFSLPICSPAAVTVRIGGDLVVYNPVQPVGIFMPAYEWVEYQQAKRFDRLVR